MVRKHLRVGMEVETAWFGRGIVEKINRKTARIGSTGTSGTYSTNVDLSHISLPLKTKKLTASTTATDCRRRLS
ncbi:MAG: hypothetical protein HYY96_09415 [Candidatus Tectomicrobia bacterium]|nr:hypothetical protein [Candidatus Tectomicrobia bacterium]